ncbi:MAG: hypothetical protein HQL95_15170 [Magnetococcales bacterium]|nr:hypothetical protein [Magnetococcales bacterium]
MARPKKTPAAPPPPDPELAEEMPGDIDQGSILTQPETMPTIIGAGVVIEEEIQNDADVVLSTAGSMLDRFTRAMTDQMKKMERPWGAMSAADRQTLVDNLQWSAQDLITQATETIAANGRRIVTGVMKQVAIKDEITATITCGRSAEACAAFGMASGGGPVAFILLDTESYLSRVNPVDVGPRQLEMNIDDDADKEILDHISKIHQETFGGDIQDDANEETAAAFLGVTPVDVANTNASTSTECPL